MGTKELKKLLASLGSPASLPEPDSQSLPVVHMLSGPPEEADVVQRLVQVAP